MLKTLLLIVAMTPVLGFVGACSRPDVTVTVGDGIGGLDSLNARLERVYADHDAARYATLFTDSAVFEWPGEPNVRGRPALEAMAKGLWPALLDLKLKVRPTTRRSASQHATEFGAFEESWRDSTGGRTTEFGRYVSVFARQADGSWLIDRWLGFSDSTRSVPVGK